MKKLTKFEKKIFIQEWFSVLLNIVNSNDNNIFKHYKEKKCKIYKCNFLDCFSFVDMLKYIDKRYLVISLNIFTTDKELALNNYISNNCKN